MNATDRSDVTAVMTDKQTSDDVNKIQQQEDEDGEIKDENYDEVPGATGIGARLKTTVTSEPTKPAKTVR